MDRFALPSSRRLGRRRPHSSWLVRGIASVAVLLVLPLVAWPSHTPIARADNSACPWMDTSQGPDVRAQELMDAMTLQQKERWLDEQAANTPSQTAFGSVTYPAQVPCTPVMQYADGPWEVTGVTGITTGFPVPIAQTATWDDALSRLKGAAMGDEAFNEHRDGILGPGINLARVPYGGRNAEFMGEDPLLAGVLAGDTIQGIENVPGEPVDAVVKHLIANDQELDRQTGSSNLDDRTLQELDGLAFNIAVRDGQPGGVMCSYNQINGTYACENPSVQNSFLKNEVGYKGFIVSDFGAVHSTAPSLNGGLDQELNRPNFYSPANLQAALTAGTITETQIDQAAYRVARAAIANGLFDTPMPATPAANSSTSTHLALAAQVAEEGSVLLKNDSGALPLTGSGLKIAVIGPTASATATAGVSAKTICSSSGEPSAACSNNPGFVAPLDAITARAAQAGDTVVFDNGSNPTTAAATAASADVAIVFGYYTEGEGADRTNISLDNNGDALISAVTAAQPNTDVVLETGSAVLMPWLSSVKSVLEAWYPGVQQGNAISALLFGDANASGKLPVTFPKSTADLPTTGSGAQYPGVFADGSTTRAPGDRTSIRQVNYTEGLKIGYRWYDSQNIAPLFPFGFGLSYTTFSESITNVSADGNGGANVDVNVTNTGSRSGSQVVELYVQDPASSGEPSKTLQAFSRVTLDPGASQTVHLHLSPWAFAHWDTTGQNWLVDAGSYNIDLGTDEQTIVSSQALNQAGCTIAGTATASTCTSSPFTTPEGSAVNGPVASFTAFSPAATAAEYTATIDWGDGTTPTTGTVTAGSNGQFTVNGTHSYADNGSFTVTTTIVDNAKMTGSTVTTTPQATVTNVPPTAAFNFPTSVFAGSSFTLSLTNPSDPSPTDTAAGFQYAFDCGAGAGYSAFSSSSSVACPTISVGQRTVKGKIRDKDGGTTDYTGTVHVVVTAQSLCNLTKQFVESSSKYQALKPAAQKTVNAVLTAACNALAGVNPNMNPIVKSIAVHLYDPQVNTLAATGWLTPAQATELRNIAGSL